MTEFILTQPADFRFRATVYSHGWCQLPPFLINPEAEPLTLHRMERLSDGTSLQISISEASTTGLRVCTDLPLNEMQQAEVAAVVSRCLSFEQVLDSFYNLTDSHQRYSWVRQAGAGRMLKAPTVWEDLGKILLTTNTTWTMTIQMVSRLVTLGDQHPSGQHAFPTPQQVAALDLDALNAHVRAGYRGAYLHELARRIVEEGLDVEAWHESDLTSQALYKQIRTLKGFGDYAAGSILRLLGRHDYLGIDSVCREMYRKSHNNDEKAPDSVIHAHYEPYGAWRGLVMWMDVMTEDLTDG